MWHSPFNLKPTSGEYYIFLEYLLTHISVRYQCTLTIVHSFEKEIQQNTMCDIFELKRLYAKYGGHRYLEHTKRTQLKCVFAAYKLNILA